MSAYGSAEKKGAMMAVEELNKAGGINGKKIEVTSKDNKSDNSEAATVATSLTTQEKVNAIVGPATSGATASAAPSSQLAGVPLVTPSGTTDDLTVTKKGETKEYVFRTTFIDSYQGQILSTFASNNLNAKKVVLYYDNSSDYGKGIAKEFKKHYNGDCKQVFISESACRQEAESVAVRLKEINPEIEIIINQLGPVITSHAGPGVIAVYFTVNDRME